ncbi:hypothetical protein D3C72_1657900 [compost metagenome]
MQDRDRVEGQRAVRPAAIGNDFRSRRQLGKASFKLVDRNIDRTGKMARSEFILRADIQQRDAAFPHPQQQLFTRNRLKAVWPILTIGDEATDLGTIVLGVLAQGREQADHRTGSQPIKHALAVPPGLDKAGASQLLQMLRGVGDAEAGQLGEALHRAFALGDVLEQKQALGARKRAGELGKFFENVKLKVGH